MVKIILFIIISFIILSLSGCIEDDIIRTPTFTPKQYINASNITVVGAGSTSGSLDNISDLNMGYFNVSEGNAQPFYVIVNFTNVTNFSFLEAKARYFSLSGTPSSHVVDLEIYCTTDNEYEDLFFLENADDWRYFTRHFPDAMHFIDANGNVSIKFNHPANGNVNHVLWIDTVRLITSAQYEQNIIYLTQNITSGTGSQNLSQVLTQGNNAANQSINNITGINSSTDVILNTTGSQADLKSWEIRGNNRATIQRRITAGSTTPQGVLTLNIVNSVLDGVGESILFSIDNETGTRSFVGRMTLQVINFTNHDYKMCYNVRNGVADTFAFSEVACFYSNQTLTINKLAGTGNAYVCVYPNGTLFRGSPTC